MWEGQEVGNRPRKNVKKTLLYYRDGHISDIFFTDIQYIAEIFLIGISTDKFSIDRYTNLTM